MYSLFCINKCNIKFFFFLICIFVQAPIGFASTYYVDATGGNDSNNGITVNTPWKTISRINIRNFIAGDNILFKKGETWHEQLNISSSGTSSKPITYSAYGTGDKPIIDGDNIRQYGIFADGESYITIDGFILKRFKKDTLSYAVYISGGAYNIVKNCDISEVYYATNPNPGTTTWEVQYGVGIQLIKCNGAIISGNTIRDCGSSGILYGTQDNIVLTNSCEISDNEITNVNTGIRVTSGNTSGVAITNVKIFNNYIHDFNNYYYCNDWHRDGIHIWSTAGNSAVSIENVEIYNNYFDDTINHTVGSTAWIYIEYNCKNFSIHHNILNNCPGINSIKVNGLSGVSPFIKGGHKFYNNTIRAILDENNGTGLSISYSTGHKIKNNIFYAQKIAYSSPDINASTGFESDYNLIIRLDGGDDIASVFGGLKTFTELKALGIETHTIYADPKFIGDGLTGTQNSNLFKLLATSPAIDKGTNLGFTSDFEGNPIPQGSAPDLGAFESSVPPPPVINSVWINPSSGFAKIGTIIKIVVIAANNQKGLIPSTASINNKLIPLYDEGNGTYTGYYLVAEGDVEGTNVEATNITLTGIGGTSAVASSSGSTLKIDSHKPIIASLSLNPYSGWLKTGSTVTISLIALNNETVLTASNAQINGKGIPFTNHGNGTFSGIYTVQSDDTQGLNIEATGVTLTDAAGNESMPASSTGSSLKIDTTPPQIKAVELTATSGKLVAPDDSIAIIIYEKNNESGLIASDATIQGKNIIITDQGDGTYKGYYIVQVDDTVGPVEAINITLSDAAGNCSLPASSSNSGIFIVSKTYFYYSKSDFNKDSIIDFADLVMFGEKFGLNENQQEWDSIFDLVPDGKVDFLDFTVFSDSYGRDISIKKETFSNFSLSDKLFEFNVTSDEKSSQYSIEITIPDHSTINGFEFNLSYDENSAEFVENSYSIIPRLFIPISNKGKVTLTAYYNDEKFDGKILFNFKAINNQSSSFFEITKALISDEHGISRIDLSKTVNKKNISLYENKKISYELFQNQPNPFNSNTTISYFVYKAGAVQVEIFNIDGQKIKTLINGFMQAGKYNIEFDASGLSSGIYFYKMVYNNSFNTKKMLFVK